MSEFDREQKLQERGDARQPRRILFPPVPPPLGVPLHLASSAYILGAPPELLRAEMLEPYFAPLSTRLMEPDKPIRKETKRQLAEYQKARGELLTELQRNVRALGSADRAARFSSFSSLARVQTPKLQILEAQADTLRIALARGIGWSAMRTWQLGDGELDRPRPENRVLEHQVLRAAVFYQEGLNPAQRRLAREAVQVMEETVFRGDEAPAPTMLFPFFSPDLARVPPPDMTPTLAAAFDQYQLEKHALRRELQNAVYETDRLTELARTNALRRLAENHAARLTALEELAEVIRAELALAARTRRPAPQWLRADLEAKINDYLAARRRIQHACENHLRPIASQPPPAQASRAALDAWKEQRRLRIQAATDKFVEARAKELEQLNHRCHEINARLAPYLREDERDLDGESLDASMMEFLLRYRQEVAYYEYDVAVFEPGLSPEQRRLLFAGAVARLELPLAGPERQAINAPKTLLR